VRVPVIALGRPIHSAFITTLLKNPDGKDFGVIGNNDTVTAATIEIALKNMEGIKSFSKMYFAGNKQYFPKLNELAKSVGVEFEGIPYPVR
jgi:hypothetical protein